MRNICCPTYFYNILCYFTPGCKYLQQLDLTLCDFSSSHFVQFLENCGRRLTHLRFIECRLVDNAVLFKIAEICKNLKELDLTGYLGEEGLLYCLEYLGRGLEQLKLEGTEIEARRICEVLHEEKQRRRKLYFRSCNHWQRYSLEHEYLPSIYMIVNESGGTPLRLLAEAPALPRQGQLCCLPPRQHETQQIREALQKRSHGSLIYVIN